MDWTHRRWFRELCRIMAVISFLYSIHPVTLGVQQAFAPLFQHLGPVAAYAQTPGPLPAAEEPFAPVLSVARTLSAISMTDVQNNQVTITYTIFNLQVAAVSGLLLATTLEPGVSFQSASPLPDQNGQELAWSLGTVAGFGSTRVQLTVTLATPVALQLDSGARVFGYRQARAVQASVSAATLRQDAVAADLLQSTPDANTSDTFVLAKAAELGHDVQRIFAFVRDEIGYESYRGSLRGARGTLWSKAGNALDQASLLVALLRASGIPARYVAGMLPDALAQQLILSMFPPNFQRVGFIPAGTAVADPANDSRLLEETREHYWVEFDEGNGFLAVDPTFAEAQVGQTFTTAQNTFAVVSETLRHTVTVRLKREITTPLSGLFGVPSQDVAPILNQTFNTVEVVGKPLSIGHFVHSATLSALIFTSITNTYAPYILVGQNDDRLEDDPIIRGTDYQEILTNFPFGSQILTGLFLEIDVTNPDGSMETFTRTVADRIGFTVRQNGGSPSLTFDANNAALLQDLDIITVNVLPSQHNTAVLFSQLEQIRRFQERVTDVQQRLSTAPSDTGPEADLLAAEATAAARNLLMALTWSRAGDFAALSDFLSDQLQQTYGVRAYYDSPRLTIVSHRLESDIPNSTTTGRLAIDLRRNRIRAVAFPAQNARTPFLFNVARGIADNVVEREVLAVLASPNDPQGLQMGANTASIFEAALAQAVNITLLSSENVASVSALSISDEAKARITAAITQGKIVFVPSQSVLLNETAMIAWYEQDPQTGETFGVTEDGGHAAGLVERNVSLFLLARQPLGVLAILVGAFLGSVTVAIQASLRTDCIQGNLTFLPSMDDAGCEQFVKDLKSLISRISAGLTVAAFVIALATGNEPAGLAALALAAFEAATAAFTALGISDPPLSPFLSHTDIVSVFPTHRALAAVPVVATLQPGLVQGTVQAGSFDVSQVETARWETATLSGFLVQTFTASNALVQDANGGTLGTGEAVLTAEQVVPVAISGSLMYDVSGRGRLSSYAPATTDLGVSGHWDMYTASLSGNVTLRLSTDALTLNDTPLPSGTYTITAPGATLTGSGASTAPNFVNDLSLTVTEGTMHLGPGTGNITVDGDALESAQGLTAAGFSGTVAVTAAADTDTIQLDGEGTHVLRVSGTPVALATDQNTPQSFTVVVQTSLTDTYTLTAEAPTGWTVTLDVNGMATVTPAAGLQGGIFPIRVTAQSQTRPELQAQGEVLVSVGDTQPGVTLSIVPDPLFTVPFNGAQVPSAFRVVLRNLGPAMDTFALTFPTVPAGFTVLNSGNLVTLPAGETAQVGLYLQPTGQIGAPGTAASFSVTTTSTSNPVITATDSESFTLPEVHGVTLRSDPPTLSSIPGAPTTTTLTLQAVGNIPENVQLAIALPLALTASALTPVMLGVGETATQMLVLTPATGTPLNTTLAATVTATFGPSVAPLTQTSQITVQIAAPGTQSAAEAAATAARLGDTTLAATLQTLSLALTTLVQTPTDLVAANQVLSHLDSLITQSRTNPFLANVLNDLITARTTLANATTPVDILTAVDNLSTSLTAVNTSLTALALFNFEVSLLPNSQVAQPQSPGTFTIVLRNTGTAQSTYNVSLGSLPAGVVGMVSQPSVTLDPGQVTPPPGSPPLMVTLTQTSTTQLAALTFDVIIAVDGAPEITRTVQGAFTARDAFVSVVSVSTDPPFTDPGGQVNVSARLLNAVNQEQDAEVSYVVQDPNGQAIFTSPPVQTGLTVLTSLTTVDLGTLDTTGFGLGPHTLVVMVTDLNGQPIPGATAQGSLLLGSPVQATLTLTPETLPPGNGTVSNTLQIDSELTAVPPLSLLSLSMIPNGARGVAVRNNLAYVCGGADIRIYDVTDPVNPVFRGSFGAGSIGCKIVGDLLVAIQAQGFNPFILLVYSLRNDPLIPTLLGTSGPINYFLPFDLQLTSTNAFVTEFLFCFFLGSNDIYIQTGDLLTFALNLDDPVNPTVAAPTLLNVLFNAHGDAGPDPTDVPGCAENGGDGNLWQIAQADAQTLLLATTTVTGTDTQTGVGLIRSVDIADPANPSVVGTLQIPGTVHAIGLAIEGNRAFVVGSTGGWNDFFSNVPGDDDSLLIGNLVFTVLDITDPRTPQILGSRTITRRSRTFWTSTVALGNGLFAFSNLGGASESIQLLLINTSDPSNIAVGQTDVPNEHVGPNAIIVSGNTLFTTSASGLLIYNIGAIPPLPVTARVVVPRNTGVDVVANSFNTPPTQIVNDPDFDTLVWDLLFVSGTTSQTLTWQTSITNLQPGEARDVTVESRVEFVSQGTPGQVPLPPLAVSSEQILGLTPATQTVRPGDAAAYMLTVRNPTALDVTYTLSVQGVPQTWVTLAPTVTVAAQGMTDLPLTLTADTFATLGMYGFVVNANAPTGAMGSVRGAVELQGDPVLPDATAHGVVLTLTPAQATAGQGTTARFMLRVSNTGSATEPFMLTGTFPAGVTGSFSQDTIDVPPGTGNFREILLGLTPQPGTVPGNLPFTVMVASVTVPTVGMQVQGTLSVLNTGVDVTLSPALGTPGGTYQLTVTNTGQIMDTFDLALGGPVGLVATLPMGSVTLAPGTSQTFTVPIGALDFVLPGNALLTAVATSRANTTVQDTAMASANVVVSQGLTTFLTPMAIDLPMPGPAAFLLQIQNTGNAEEAYTATIVSTSGAITAGLMGLDGEAMPTVPLFRLPGLATGALTLSTVMTQTGVGTVTVRVDSVSTPGVTAMATAMVRVGENQPPVAAAGPPQSVRLGQTVQLDGRGSADSDNGPQPLAFFWRFSSVPDGSTLTSAALRDASTATASFLPDVVGNYVVELQVSDGLASAVATVTISVTFPEINQSFEVVVVEARSTLDRQTRQVISTAEVFITNISTRTFQTPLQAEFRLSEPDIELLEASVDAAGRLVVDLAPFLTGGLLGPGQSITVPVTFVRAFPGRFSYEITLLGLTP